MSDKLAKLDESAPVRALAPQSFNDVARMSSALAQAKGFVPRDLLGQPHAIAAAIMTGMEIGIGPMQSLRSIYVIDGRPMLSADLLLSLAIRGGVRPQWLHTDAERAHLRLTRAGFEPHEHTFTIAEAKLAGLAGRGNWTKYPAAMLRARCLSAACRAYCPDVIGSGVYVEGEIEASDERDEEPQRRREEPDTIEGQLAEAERPRRAVMSDCTTKEQLAAWVQTNAVALQRNGGKSLDKVVEYAHGVGVEDPITWVNGLLKGVAA